MYANRSVHSVKSTSITPKFAHHFVLSDVGLLSAEIQIGPDLVHVQLRPGLAVHELIPCSVMTNEERHTGNTLLFLGLGLGLGLRLGCTTLSLS